MIARLLKLLPLVTGLAVAPPLPAQFDAFEVATIKPAGPRDQRAAYYLRMQSAHVFQAKNYTVHGMIAAAFDLNPRAISGGPAWVDSEAWEILAKTPGEKRPTWDDQMAMLRKLLADRFHLTFHREKKQFDVYELTASKGGSKLKPTEAPPDEAPKYDKRRLSGVKRRHRSRAAARPQHHHCPVRGPAQPRHPRPPRGR